MVIELAGIAEMVIILRDRAEKEGLHGIEGYLNSAIENLQEAAKNYHEHKMHSCSTVAPLAGAWIETTCTELRRET